jgi:3D (Asp-Asp-Asp) domain-containing protein
MGAFLFSGLSTAFAPAQAAVPDAIPAAYTVALTGYNAVPAQTKADPSTTANGGPSNPFVVAARSRDLAAELPYGTIIEIDGPAADSADCGYNAVAPLVGYRVITDTMNERIKNTVDILFSTKANYVLADSRKVNASALLGSCDVSIKVVGHLDLTHVGDLPKTQADLAALVENSGLAIE